MDLMKPELSTVTPILPESEIMVWAKVLVDSGYQAHIHEIAHGPKGAPAVIVAGFYVRTDAPEAFVADIGRQYEEELIQTYLREPTGKGS